MMGRETTGRVLREPAAATLVELLQERVSTCGDSFAYTFLEDGEQIGERVTYAQLAQRSQHLAAHLQQRFAPGDRLLLLYPSCIEYMVAFFACLCAGLIAVPLFPPRGTKRNLRLEAIARDCSPRGAMTTSKWLTQMDAVLKASEGLASVELLCSDALPVDVGSWREPRIEPMTTAFLQYTSGSTGLPKGVVVNHSNVLHNEFMIASCFEAHSQSDIVTWLPIYHDMGLIGNLLQSFWLGSQSIFMAPVAFLQRPARWLRAISQFGARVSGGPNFAYDLCVDKIQPAQREALDLSRWAVAFNGAEPVRRSTLERFAAEFGSVGFKKSAFLPCYGMAESTLIAAGGAVHADPIYVQADKAELGNGRVIQAKDAQSGQWLVSSGAPVQRQSICIVDPVTKLECPQNVVGEIWMSGPNITDGYWNRPDVNEEIFNAHIADCARGPYLRTGDLGFLKDRELFVTGRLKDVIIVRGTNHYPQDIEASVEATDPSINSAGVAAFGIAGETKERVVAVAEIGRTSLRKVDVQALANRVRQHVLEEREVLLDDVVFIRPGTLPKSSSGKVQRSYCRTLYLQNELDRVTANAVATEAV
jgi:acyl-CoA synthetase (AMP-forming)/AMP-acid ligase II